MGARSWSECRSQSTSSSTRSAHPSSPPSTTTVSTATPGTTGPSPGHHRSLHTHHHQGSPNKKQPNSQEPITVGKQKQLLSTTPPPLENSALYTPFSQSERQRLEAAIVRDRVVRLQSVQTDILVELPPAIALPDGEEHPVQHPLHHIGKTLHLRDQDQESEIYRGYIRPPPNRTILESGCQENPAFLPQTPPPFPFRSSSVGGMLHKQQWSSANPQKTSLDFLTGSNSSLVVTRSNSVSCPLGAAPSYSQRHDHHLRHLSREGLANQPSSTSSHPSQSFTSQLRALKTTSGGANGNYQPLGNGNESGNRVISLSIGCGVGGAPAGSGAKGQVALPCPERTNSPNLTSSVSLTSLDDYLDSPPSRYGDVMSAQPELQCLLGQQHSNGV